uniref:Uncharacterized protein n=1 Tax=Octopus bimaculoides TaxID=37653 RepID=A0A0L8GCB3_OCTBM
MNHSQPVHNTLKLRSSVISHHSHPHHFLLSSGLLLFATHHILLSYSITLIVVHLFLITPYTTPHQITWPLTTYYCSIIQPGILVLLIS